MNNNEQRGFASVRAEPCVPVRVDRADARAAGGSEATITACDGHAFVIRRTPVGAPILMLHDMVATQQAWDPVRAALPPSCAVCTWDARGHGDSRGSPESAVPTLGLLAADLDAAIAAYAHEAPVLVGHGLGALTILEYLRNYGPGRVSRVVLVDQSPRMLTAPDWPLALFGGFRATDSLEFESQIRADCASAWRAMQARGRGTGVESVPLGRQQGGRQPLATGSMLALWRSMIARDYRADLAVLQVPLLAVLGANSNLYDAALLGRWFQQNVPGAQVASYPKAGHAPHAANPARFARDIAAFAAQRTPPSRNHVMVVARGGASAPPAFAKAAA